jgi:hypothetical protein
MSPSHHDLLGLEIDTRLAALWGELPPGRFTDEDLALFAVFLRAAYGKGYADALTDPHGQLMTDFGYPVPRRRAA